VTRRLRLLLALPVLFATATAAADTYPRQTGIDALHYRFRLSLRDDTDAIEGEAAVTLAFPEGGTSTFWLDLANSADANGRGMAVSEVTSDGCAVSFTHQANRLDIKLPDAPKAGERREFTVRYKGVPAAGLRIGPNRHGERSFFSNNWPDNARHWLPTIDHPHDKATSEFLVEAPAVYQVVANGSLVEESDTGDGRRLTHWKESVPIATWLNALGVARFTAHHAGTVRGVPLQTWVNPKDRAAGLDALEGPARRALEFFSDQIGPFPYEKLGCIQAAGTDGGMEHAGAIFFGERSVDRGPAHELVSHEIAHQWFGDSLTERDWDEVWLSESFATYFALRFIDHEKGDAAFRTGLQRARQRVFAAEARDPKLAVLHAGLADTRKILNPLVYQKGGWVLHMLRGQIGAAAFDAGIRKYYLAHRDGNVTTADFRRAMEEAAGGTDLGWFLDQWLRRPGHPVLEGHWRYDAAAKAVVLELAQTQSGDPYRLPLEVRLAPREGAAAVRKVEMNQRQQEFTIPADGEPAAVVLDPDTRLLVETRVDKQP
jgi:aminopeptidase N